MNNSSPLTMLSIGLLILLSSCASSQDSTKQKKAINSHLNIIGHRGFAGLYPENSLLSIQKALDLGVDRIEIDIQQSKDQVIVALHDKTLNRTTNGKGKVKDYTYAELRQFQLIGPDQQLSKELIPRLDEILQLIDGRTQLLIEIKSGNELYPKILERTLDLIDQHQAKSWCIIQSFSDSILEELHRLDPSISLHKLLVSAIFYNLDRLPFVNEFSVNYYFASKGLIDRVHAMHKKINVWTVNDEVKMQRVIHAGIDGIITDRPDLLINGTILTGH